MKLKLTALFILLISILESVNAQTPVYRYLSDFKFKNPQEKLRGPARVITRNGREGLNMTSIHSALEMKAHTLKSNAGSVSLWVMSLEDLATYRDRDKMGMQNPYYGSYPFLSDNPNPQNVDSASFKFLWGTFWHPNLRVQFGKGNYYDDNFKYPHRAFISVSHFSLKQYQWYQYTLTWNYKEDRYSLYVNGILIGREDHFKQGRFHRDTVNTSMFAGNPTLCLSDIRFYNQELNAKEIYANYRQAATNFDPKFEDELKFTYAGKNHKTFDFKLGADWQNKLNLTFTKPSDKDSMHVQGNPVGVNITKDGLLVETINRQYTGALLDSQVYVWSKKFFEGDLYVEYDFKILRPGGLSLLMVQATGMNREDFMADYPLKTNGRMTTVYGENVRNYHWEYYREMSDMRNDVQNSVLAKNPFGYALSFSALNKPYDYERWNKLQFLQIGNKLIGAINGVVMVEFTDDGFINNGPVLNAGRIAIRCMLHSKMLFRNLKVYNRQQFKVVETLNKK